MHQKSPKQLEDFLRRVRRRRWLKRLRMAMGWLFMGLVLLLLVGWFVLQSEGFQNWAIDKVTSDLSERLGTPVQVDYIDIDFFDNMVLEGFYIEDDRGDTLLYSGELTTSLTANLLTLLGRDLNIKEIHLEKGILNIQRSEEQAHSNLQRLLDKLVPDKNIHPSPSSKSTQPFFLSIDNIYIHNVKILWDDKLLGKTVQVHLPTGYIDVEEIDLQNQTFEINSIDVHHLAVRYLDFPKARQKLIPETIPDVEDKKGEKQKQIKNEHTAPLSPKLIIHRIDLADAVFELHNYRKAPLKTTPEHILDWKHLQVSDIQVAINELNLDAAGLAAQVESIAAKESSGFELSNLRVNDLKITPHKTELYGLRLETPHSSVGDSLILKYRNMGAFQDFENKVLTQAYFKNAKIALQDIAVFAPRLYENTFFINSFKEIISLNGYVYGTINSLKGKRINARIGTATLFTGHFRTKNLALKDEEYLSLDIQHLRSDMKTLRLLIPNFNPPHNFDKLGSIDFSGKFNGFFNDFSAFGNLNTALGYAHMDMGLDISQGKSQAKYYGSLDLFDFDLATWTENPNLGNITFTSQLLESEGLSLETVNARGKAHIHDFTFKKHRYEDIFLDGQLQKNYFNGKLSLKERFVDLDFDGAVDFLGDIPKYDFKADVRKLDLQGLNLLNHKSKNFAFSGKLDINGQGKDMVSMQGTAIASDLKIIHNNKDFYRMDSVYLFSNLSANLTRTLTIDSDILKASIIGQYEIQEVPDVVTLFLQDNFPEISYRIKLKSKTQNIGPAKLGFDIHIPDSRNFATLLAAGIDTIRNARITGYLDTKAAQLELDASLPFVQYNQFTCDDLYLHINSDQSYAELEMGVYKTTFKNQTFKPIDFEGVINRDTLEFNLSSTNFNSLLDDLDLNGELFFKDNFFQLRFLSSQLVLLENKWTIDKDNYVRFGKNFVETNKFDLYNNDKHIGLRNMGQKGLEIDLENIRLSIIDEYWDFSKIDFDGQINIHTTIGDLFKMEDIQTIAIADTFEINGDDWGSLRLDAEMSNTTSPINVFMSITKGQEQITAEGFVGPFGKSPTKRTAKDYSFQFNITHYPLSIAEYFIENGLSNTIGTFDADVLLDGNFKSQPNISGSLEVEDLALTIDYLQTRYSMDKGYATISNTLFDVSGNSIKDKHGNTAFLHGGITHDHLSNFQLATTISSDKFLFLETDVEDNPLYYGTAFGKGLVRFNGPFKKTDIYIDASTLENSVLNIPVSYEQNADEVTFIQYRDKNAPEKKDEENIAAKDLRGVSVDLYLDVNALAEVYIIFDERAGDKIHGRGEGAFNLKVDRSGTIEMYGDYIIEQGEYLFTLLNLVNKPFLVKRGGTIVWDGDPLNALIDLEATYPTRTSLSTLLLEYFDEAANPDLEALAKKSTPVGLTMFLTGRLLKPEINFDIDFPYVDNELRNFVESKLSSLRSDQNELNRQVFGLMVVGSFLPSGDAALNGRGFDIGFNTLTEMLSNQLSIYLTNLLDEIFTDVGFISGIDFDVNYNYYTTDELSPEGRPVLRTGSELEVRMSNSLFNDRLSVNMGGNIDWGGVGIEGSPSEGAFLAGDLVIEYILTKDRRFKVRFYQRTDQSIEGRRNKTGLGFSYRREFDTFEEFLKGMRRAAKGTRSLN